MSEVLDVWPALPLILISRVELPLLSRPKSGQRWDNTVAALESEHHNRICQIYISDMTNSRWKRFTTAMQKPFLELINLEVLSRVDLVSVLPDSFLGGSSPRLRTLRSDGIPFLSMPKLLLSANGLVTHSLEDIPDSGYISPDAMATALTVMTRLKTLHLGFRSPRSRPDPASRLLPPPTRFVLPALTEFIFEGVYDYLEDLVARIDAPLLEYLRIIFFMDLKFDISQLHRFIGHAEEFKTFDHAVAWISDVSIRLGLYPQTEAVYVRRLLEFQISCRGLDWQLSSLAQVCNSSFPLTSALEELRIRENYFSSSHWKDDMEVTQWVELLDPFTALKSLCLTDIFALHVCGSVQELPGERETVLLPALRNLFVRWNSVQPAQEAMMSARRLSGHPIVVNRWES